jgi:hypothetical protein
LLALLKPRMIAVAICLDSLRLSGRTLCSLVSEPCANRGFVPSKRGGQPFAPHVDRAFQVPIIKAWSRSNHECQIETAVGHQHMVCTMRDTGVGIEVRGGQM